MIQKVKYFFQKEIWIKELDNLSSSQSFLITQIRVIILAVKGFEEDKCMLRSSALTFYSLLSFVPVIAMLFGISKGFGIEEKIDALLLEKLGSHKEIMTNVIAFSHNMLNNTKGGLIAGIGIAVLFWSVIKVMTNIEKSFNAIWGIVKERTLTRKISEYLIIMLIAPLLLVLASSATVFVSSSVENLMHYFNIGYINEGAHFFLKLLPYGIIWLLFTFIYKVMPNTNVSWKSALFAAIVAGTIFEIVQWGYVKFQIGVAGYNAIYGSFAAIPLFLAWLQTSWLIILFGGELSFAHQNVAQYRLENESQNISTTYRKKLTLFILHAIIIRFIKGEQAATFDELKKETQLPFRLLQAILSTLEKAKIIVVLKDEENTINSYQPAVDTDILTINYVLTAIENIGIDKDIRSPTTETYQKIEKIIEDKNNVMLKEI